MGHAYMKGKRMKLFIALVLTLLLTACGAGTFTVSKVDKTFSQNKNQTYTSENNRISTKSVAGGIHIDASGVFLNPFVVKDYAGKTDVVGFNIVNKTDFDSTYGGPNQLGYIQKVVFRFPSGELITVAIENQENESADTIQYNSVTRSASYRKYETGVAILSLADFKRVASAKVLSCKIEGSKHSVVYEEKDISAGFLTNINHFYSQYILGSSSQ